ADTAKDDHRAKRNRGVTFYGSVRESFPGLICLEAHPIAEFDIGEEVTAITDGVQIDPLIHPHEEVRDDVRITVCSHGRGTTAVSAREERPHLFRAHDLVAAAQVATTWYLPRNVLLHHASKPIEIRILAALPGRLCQPADRGMRHVAAGSRWSIQ